MEGSVRCFAGEFSQSACSVPGEDPKSPAYIVTPSGAYCRQVFLAGALTEVREDGDLLFARLADPTGGFDLVCNGRGGPVAETLRTISIPSFVTVLGRAQMYRAGSEAILSIRPEDIRPVDRATRDQWVLATATATLSRLEQVRLVMAGQGFDERAQEAVRLYLVTPARIREILSMVEAAVTGIRPADTLVAEQPDARPAIIDLLKTNPGPRGMAVQEIIDAMAADGIFQDAVLAAIESLVVDDECYQPQKGYIRLL